jgi:hypothetical protein
VDTGFISNCSTKQKVRHNSVRSNAIPNSVESIVQGTKKRSKRVNQKASGITISIMKSNVYILLFTVLILLKVLKNILHHSSGITIHAIPLNQLYKKGRTIQV